MTVCVYGLGHLGCIVAACLSTRGLNVVGLDPDDAVVRQLRHCQPPVFEPGLVEVIQDGTTAGRLFFTADSEDAVPRSDVLWVTFDTPVDEDDNADTESILDWVRSVFRLLREDSIAILSSQLPVGSIRKLEEDFAASGYGTRVSFACIPENLRRGDAVNLFLNPDRVVIGVRDEATRARLTALLSSVFPRILWVGIESAEMTKHALNAFLATSVAFINEIAAVSDRVGADVAEVEAALRSEARIGSRAYLHPGSAFGGGTLARDLVFMTKIAEDLQLVVPLLSGVKRSNDYHRGWAFRQLRRRIRRLDEAVIAVWGLSYKPGTSLVRRSIAIELCNLLAEAGATLRVHDPVITRLPAEITGSALMAASPLEACEGADALVVATEGSDYAQVTSADVVKAMKTPLVIDPNGFMKKLLEHPAIELVTVGRSS
jgi:UDPglucose 6-dehydrogenase